MPWTPPKPTVFRRAPPGRRQGVPSLALLALKAARQHLEALEATAALRTLNRLHTQATVQAASEPVVQELANEVLQSASGLTQGIKTMTAAVPAAVLPGQAAVLLAATAANTGSAPDMKTWALWLAASLLALVGGKFTVDKWNAATAFAQKELTTVKDPAAASKVFDNVGRSLISLPAKQREAAFYDIMGGILGVGTAIGLGALAVRWNRQWARRRSSHKGRIYRRARSSRKGRP